MFLGKQYVEQEEWELGEYQQYFRRKKEVNKTGDKYKKRRGETKGRNKPESGGFWTHCQWVLEWAGQSTELAARNAGELEGRAELEKTLGSASTDYGEWAEQKTTHQNY